MSGPPPIMKNAIMVIQELCVKSGTTPKYTEIQVTPPNQNPPVFRTTCDITFQGNSYTAIGEANTKKGAKLKACESMIFQKLTTVLNMTDPDTKKILGIVDRKEETILASSSASSSSGSRSTTSSPSKSSASSSSRDLDEPLMKQVKKVNGYEEPEEPMAVDKLVVDELSEYAEKGNPIEDLTVFCDKYRLPLPKYPDGPRHGPSHRPILSVKCIIDTVNYEPLGVYLDKKKAKRIVAEKMLTELKRRVENGEIKLAQNPDGNATVMYDPEEKLRVLSIVENNSQNPAPSKTEPSRRMNKTFDDFVSRSFLEEIRKNEFASLRKMGGPRVQEMIAFAEEVNRKYPLEAKPLGPFRDWLTAHELGISEFVNAIKTELRMSIDTVALERPDKKTGLGLHRYMISLNADIPGIENRQPAIVTFDDDRESGKINAMVELVMYLGLMTVG